MKTIHKYLLPFAESAKIELPINSEILRIDSVEGHLYLWAVVNTDNPMETRNLRLFKTGAEIPKDIGLNYLGCGAIFIQMELMLYVFEVIS